MRLPVICAAALLLAGCVDSNVKLGAGATAASASSLPRPKAIVVSDFVVAPEVLLIDRGYTSRLERRIGPYPTHERKPRTMERVNDEIVASMVATLREAGLEAQPGSEEGLTLSANAVVVSGRLRATDPAAQRNEAGIVGAKSGVTADMTLSTFSTFGKRNLLTFSAEPAGKPASGKAAAANNAAIAAVLGGAEKLSPDVEAAARKLGRDAGEKVLAYARVQGWMDKPADAEAGEGKPAEVKPADGAPADAEADPDAQMVRVPAPKPRKPAA